MTAVFQAAHALCEGDVNVVMEWMKSPVRGLGSMHSLDMLGTTIETEALLDLIGRLERGVVV
ncbi:antitoxin Xre/MbcA/ParS toxin-binding domain-containing protein [Pseudomonas defluvii]|uniref:antitoxin Xre/MbcA/ParS toxin-binding domain-containing protein n=1 Tax=Pseudomonas defluvii TaxID=1876757 RepID=UPI003906C759